MRDEEGKKKEASKVKQTIRQSVHVLMRDEEGRKKEASKAVHAGGAYKRELNLQRH